MLGYLFSFVFWAFSRIIFFFGVKTGGRSKRYRIKWTKPVLQYISQLKIVKNEYNQLDVSGRNGKIFVNSRNNVTKLQEIDRFAYECFLHKKRIVGVVRFGKKCVGSAKLLGFEKDNVHGGAEISFLTEISSLLIRKCTGKRFKLKEVKVSFKKSLEVGKIYKYYVEFENGLTGEIMGDEKDPSILRISSRIVNFNNEMSKSVLIDFQYKILKDIEPNQSENINNDYEIIKKNKLPPILEKFIREKREKGYKMLKNYCVNDREKGFHEKFQKLKERIENDEFRVIITSNNYFLDDVFPDRTVEERFKLKDISKYLPYRFFGWNFNKDINSESYTLFFLGEQTEDYFGVHYGAMLTVIDASDGSCVYCYVKQFPFTTALVVKVFRKVEKYTWVKVISKVKLINQIKGVKFLKVESKTVSLDGQIMYTKSVSNFVCKIKE